MVAVDSHGVQLEDREWTWWKEVMGDREDKNKKMARKGQLTSKIVEVVLLPPEGEDNKQQGLFNAHLVHILHFWKRVWRWYGRPCPNSESVADSSLKAVHAATTITSLTSVSV